MSLTSLLVHDVTIRRAGTSTDRYGATVKDWGTATDTEVKGWVARSSELEVNDQGREGQSSQWVLFLPAETDIVGGDRVIWRSTTYEVDGPPNPAWTPRGEHHVEARLKLVEG